MDAQDYIRRLRTYPVGRDSLEKWMDKNYLHEAFVISLCGVDFTNFTTWENEFPEIPPAERPWNFQDKSLEYSEFSELFQQNINDRPKLLDLVRNQMSKLNI